jgi:hypothetical protein
MMPAPPGNGVRARACDPAVICSRRAWMRARGSGTVREYPRQFISVMFLWGRAARD